MTLNIFATPKRVAPEAWLEIITDVICDTYNIAIGNELIKKALFESATAEGVTTYKKFIETLRETFSDIDKYGITSNEIADIICPMYLKRKEWTSVFDDTKEGKSLDGLSSRSLNLMLGASADKNFTLFVSMLWLKVNVPALYDHLV